MIAYVMPTRDRQGELDGTIARLGRLAPHAGEVVVVDNASAEPARAPARLHNGLGVRVIRLEENLGAAARTVGVRATAAATEWVVMLDDDSAPLDAAHVALLEAQPEDVAAVMADITLPDGSRERGGLPEVFIGCGVAVRRWAYAGAGGYDQTFGYYAEEYDLAARFLMAGRRVAFEPGFRVLHSKVSGGRDMDVILGRLVRNNGWVLARYCPDDELDDRLGENESRYRAIAAKEDATAGFERGLAELRATIGEQARTPMERGAWERFTGLAHAREALRAAWRERPFATAEVVERGKNDWAVERALAEVGVRVVDRGGEAVVVGTMSPGPMLDAAARLRDGGRRVVVAWEMARGATENARAA